MRPALRTIRTCGALALIAMGALHLQQYLAGMYSKVPTIGTLFVLNFVGGVALGVALLSPVERLPGRAGRLAVPVLALCGAAMAATSIAFLLISEQTSLFGFSESGYGTPIVAALVIESIATVTLAAVAATGSLAARRPRKVSGAPASV